MLFHIIRHRGNLFKSFQFHENYLRKTFTAFYLWRLYVDEWFHLFGGEELPVPKKHTHTKKALSGLSGLWRTEGWMGLKSQIQCWNGRYSDSVNLQEKQKASHHYHSTDTCVISQSVELDVFCSDSWFSALMCCDIFQMHSNLVFKAAHEKLNLSAFHMSGLSRVMPRLVLGGQ